jgi:transposase
MANSISATVTIGIDLGDVRSEVCVLGVDGEVLRRFSMATTREGLEKKLGALAPARVVIEVGTHSPWVSRWLEAKGHETLVANARAVRSIAQSDRKSDRNDAEQLARLGRADPKLLRPIRHRGEQAQRHRMQLAVRDHWVRTRTSFIVQARGLAKSLGERLPHCKSETFVKKMRALPELFPAMDEIVATVEFLDARIAAIEQELEALARTTYPETLLLRQISGVGLITALTFVLTIEDPARLPRSRAAGALLGLVPRRRQSGAFDPALRISKAGDGPLRRLLVQCAHYVLGPGGDCDLRRFGERIGAQHGRRKAVVAVARKLAVLLHRLWLTGEVYEPLRNAERKAIHAA